MRKFWKILLSVSLALQFALVARDVSFGVEQELSPLASPAYFGRFQDTFSNPAALALVEEEGSLTVAFSMGEEYDSAILHEPVGYIQNQSQNCDISVYSRNVSMTLRIGSSFLNRREQDLSEYPVFDVYSNMDLELSASYSIPYFSVGAVLKGGNSMVRMNKEISGMASALANSYMSPFERIEGSERFSLGIGALAYFDNYSIGVLIDDFVAISDGVFSADLKSAIENTSISFSAFMDRFNSEGDLRMVVPRFSILYGQFNEDTSSGTFNLNADFKFQFLPDYSLSIGLGYREDDHRLFSWNRDNGYISCYLRGEIEAFSFDAGVAVDTRSFSFYSPQFTISYTK